jgi:plastocyanin
VFLGVGVITIAGCGDDDEEAAETTTGAETAPVTTLEVSETEYKLDPPNPTIEESGKVRFKVVNDGEIAHQLTIESEDGEFLRTSDEVGVGEDLDLTVDLAPGEYDYYCPVSNHKKLGMDGTLTVAGG